MKEKSENAVDAKQNADNMRLNNEREKFNASFCIRKQLPFM
ncbi:hypothetical protein Tsp_13146 [Trichinella spiralis]|nr:hypothetical protein Tsp_13146 [Trichinella spiralis]